MAEPFLAEIRIVGFNFAPRGWAFCDGQILPINQNQSLYSLLGTTYGGDGRTSFALPDMRGRTPIHVDTSGGSSHILGQKSGAEQHALSANEMPSHNHTAMASEIGADSSSPEDNVLAAATVDEKIYHDTAGVPQVRMANDLITSAGGSQQHENMQPYLTVNFCIALQGLFPSRN